MAVGLALVVLGCTMCALPARAYFGFNVGGFGADLGTTSPLKYGRHQYGETGVYPNDLSQACMRHEMFSLCRDFCSSQLVDISGIAWAAAVARHFLTTFFLKKFFFCSLPYFYFHCRPNAQSFEQFSDFIDMLGPDVAADVAYGVSCYDLTPNDQVLFLATIDPDTGNDVIAVYSFGPPDAQTGYRNPPELEYWNVDPPAAIVLGLEFDVVNRRVLAMISNAGDFELVSVDGSGSTFLGLVLPTMTEFEPGLTAWDTMANRFYFGWVDVVGVRRLSYCNPSPLGGGSCTTVGTLDNEILAIVAEPRTAGVYGVAASYIELLPGGGPVALTSSPVITPLAFLHGDTLFALVENGDDLEVMNIDIATGVPKLRDESVFLRHAETNAFYIYPSCNHPNDGFVGGSPFYDSVDNIWECRCTSGSLQSINPANQFEELFCDRKTASQCLDDAQAAIDSGQTISTQLSLMQSAIVNNHIRIAISAAMSPGRQVVAITVGTCDFFVFDWYKSWNSQSCRDEWVSDFPVNMLGFCGIVGTATSDPPPVNAIVLENAGGFGRARASASARRATAAGASGGGGSGKYVRSTPVKADGGGISVETREIDIIEWLVYNFEIRVTFLDPPLTVGGSPRQTISTLLVLVYYPSIFAVTLPTITVQSDNGLETVIVGQQWNAGSPPDEAPTATITFLTSVRWPYKLETLSLASTPDAGIAGTVTEATASPCLAIEGESCTQTWVLEITPTEYCVVDGNYAFNVGFSCRDQAYSSAPSGCVASSTASIVLSDLTGSDICSQHYQVDSSVVATVESYSTALFDEPGTEFFLGNKVYLEAEVISSTFTVDNVVVQSLAVFETESPAGTTQYLDVDNEGAPTDSTRRVSALIVADAFDLYQGESKTFTLVLVIGIEYDDSKRRTAVTSAPRTSRRYTTRAVGDPVSLAPFVEVLINGIGLRPTDGPDDGPGGDNGNGGLGLGSGNGSEATSGGASGAIGIVIAILACFGIAGVGAAFLHSRRNEGGSLLSKFRAVGGNKDSSAGTTTSASSSSASSSSTSSAASSSTASDSRFVDPEFGMIMESGALASGGGSSSSLAAGGGGSKRHMTSFDLARGSVDPSTPFILDMSASSGSSMAGGGATSSTATTTSTEEISTMSVAAETSTSVTASAAKRKGKRGGGGGDRRKSKAGKSSGSSTAGAASTSSSSTSSTSTSSSSDSSQAPPPPPTTDGGDGGDSFALF